MKVLANSREKFILEVSRKAYKETKDQNGNVTKREVADKELADLLESAKTGKLKLQDHTYMVTAYVSGSQNVQLLNEAQNKAVGLTNIANARLPKGEYFVPVAITMIAAACDSSADADVAKAVYSPIDSKKMIQGGDITLTVNQTEKLLNEDQLAKFVGLGTGNADAPAGTIFLDSTTVVKPETRMELNLRFPAPVDPADKTAVRFLLHGTRVAPATL